MANNYKTSTKVLKKAQTHYYVACNFASKVKASYNDEFARDEKSGDTILVKRQNSMISSTSQVLAPNEVSESTDALVLNMWNQVSVVNADKDLMLAISDKDETLLKDMGHRMAMDVEKRHIVNALAGIAFTTGTAGVAPTGQTPFGYSKGIFNKIGTGDDKRYAFLTSDTETAIIGGQQTLFNPNAEITEEFHKGEIGMIAGILSYTNDILGSGGIPTGTRNVATTRTVTGYTAGSAGPTTQTPASITTSGGTSGETVLAGETFQINGCYYVGPAGQTSQVFQGVVSANATADGSGNLTFTFMPVLVLSGAGQNISAAPSGATITFYGAASTTFFWNIVMVPKFYSLGSSRLMDPGPSATMYSQNEYKGMNMRIWEGPDIYQSTKPLRLDSLTGGVTHYTPNVVPAVRVACAG